jgi:hypothetical protein
VLAIEEAFEIGRRLNRATFGAALDDREPPTRAWRA